MKVVPLGSLSEVEVPSSKIGFVQVPPGCPESDAMKADISIDSFSTDFGVLKGKVTRIGSDALEPDPRSRSRTEFPSPS